MTNTQSGPYSVDMSERWVRFLFLIVVGCGGSGSPDAAVDVDVVDDAPDAAMTDMFLASDESIDEGSDSGVTSCAEADQTARRFQAAGNPSPGGIAAEFGFEQLDGTPFSFREQFTGCDSVVFINYNGPRSTFWDSFATPLFTESAKNVLYVFTSNQDSAREDVEAMQGNVNAAFARMQPEDVAFWRTRVFFAATPLSAFSGSVGEYVMTQGATDAFAIDRAQRFDPVGSLALVASGGFVTRLQMAAYASHYFNYKAALEDQIVTEDESGDVTEVVLFDAAGVTDRIHELNADVPNMIGIDRLEVDVRLFCHASPADCSEWDRIASLAVCANAACDSQHEMVRWITPYARPGERRWLLDGTAVLGVLREGTTSFRLTLGPDWEEQTSRDVRVSLRFHRGSEPRPIATLPLFRGGEFDATYAAAHPPMTINAPADASRVELVVLLSGHGQTDGDNCAEWCDHTHRFSVGGQEFEVSFPTGIGERFGCAQLARQGVIPGQYGNWAPLRAGWCPGAPVVPHVFDVTDAVALGEANEVSYAGTLGGMTPRGGTIDLSSYLVFYR